MLVNAILNKNLAPILLFMLSDFLKRLYHVSLYQDSFWSIVGTVFGRGFSLISGIVVARLLGSDSFGEYSVIKNTIMSVALFSSFGLGITATKFISEYSNNDKTKIQKIIHLCYTITFLVGGGLSLCTFCFAQHIADFLNAPHLDDSLRLSSIAILLNSINTTQIGILGGLKAYKATAKNNTIAGIVTFLITIPSVIYYGFNGAILALVISIAFNCLINKLSIGKYIASSKYSFSYSIFKDLLSFSLPVAMQECLYSVSSWLVSFIFIKTVGYSQLGISNAAVQWTSIIAFIPGALRNVSLSHLASEGELNHKRVIFKRLLLINFISTFVPCIFIWIVSGFICSFYGAEYDGLQSVLNVMISTAVVSSITNLITQDLLTRGRTWYLFVTMLILNILTILISYVLMLRFEQGALVYAIVVLILQLLYLLAVSRKLNKLNKE